MIVIKDMDMPRACCACKLKRFDNILLEWYCQITDKALIDTGARESHCPLIEINLRVEDDEACCADSW